MNMLQRLLLLVLLVPIGCSKSGPQDVVLGKPVVFTTFYPTTYFVERIAGDEVDLQCPLPEGEDPIFWMPSSEVIQAYQQADMIVINGADFEKWITKVSLPSSKLVNISRPFEADFLFTKKSVSHSHGPGGDHSHQEMDGHTWMDPMLAKAQAGEIYNALLRWLPESQAELDRGLAGLSTDLDALHHRLAKLSEALKDEHLIAAQPMYNYLKQRYDWKLSSLDLNPSVLPDAKTQEYIASLLEGWPTRIILWVSPPVPEVARLFEKKYQLKNVVFSPCGTRPEAGMDYLSVWNENIQHLEQALSP